MNIKKFIDENYFNFNAGELKRAAVAYVDHIQNDGKMMLTIAGAMSSAKLGISISKLIRAGCVHAISTTGANLEESFFQAYGGHRYGNVAPARNVMAGHDAAILGSGKHRITDMTIPEIDMIDEIYPHLEDIFLKAQWPEDIFNGLFQNPFIFNSMKLYSLIDSWLINALTSNIPIFVPGWEDSTMGNVYAAWCLKNGQTPTIKSGIECFQKLIRWYRESHEKKERYGFFQIGGGIAGDFPICVVPSLKFDMKEDVPSWAYFCQITDAAMSYGGYSGAYPNEKISWGKLDVETPAFSIQSDATIVFPLIAEYVLESLKR